MVVEVQDHLPAGTDQDGLQQVSCAPGGLVLPHQVSGRTVGSTSTRGPNLTRTNGLMNKTHVIYSLMSKSPVLSYSVQPLCPKNTSSRDNSE